jgi:predicted transcriptional regulator
MVKVGIHVKVLTIHETSGKLMTTVKVSSQVEEKTWEELKILASESQQSISGLLTEAIAEYVQRRRVRPDVQPALVQSINDNRRLGELLVQ